MSLRVQTDQIIYDRIRIQIWIIADNIQIQIFLVMNSNMNKFLLVVNKYTVFNLDSNTDRNTNNYPDLDVFKI
jgi:hypothetical protein